MAQGPAEPQFGIVPNGSYAGYKIDAVNMENGNNIITVPLFSLPQLGTLSLGFAAISNATYWQPTANCTPDGTSCEFAYAATPPYYPGLAPNTWGGGVFGIGPAIVPLGIPGIDVVNYVSTDPPTPASNCTYLGSQGSPCFSERYFVRSSTGGRSPLYYDSTNRSQLRTTDGSGYLFLSGYPYPYRLGVAAGTPTGPPTLIDNKGIKYSVPLNNVLSLDTTPTSITDPDNNSITITPVNSSAEVLLGYKYTDSVNRVVPAIPQATTSVAGCPDVMGRYPTLARPYQSPTGSAQWVVPAPGTSNGTATYLICYTSVAIHTNFWGNGGDTITDSSVCGDSSCSTTYGETQQTLTAIQSIVLPNGTFYAFIYDAANPADAHSIAYGTIAAVTLPEGGSISYSYASGLNSCVPSFFPGPGPMVLTRRTVADGAGHTYIWNYSIDTQSIVTDPNLNDTVYTYMVPTGMGNASCPPLLESAETQYRGSHTSGTVIRTVGTTYTVTAAPPLPNDPNSAGMGNALPQRVTTTLDSGQSTATTTNNYAGSFQAVMPSYGMFYNSTTKTYTYKDVATSPTTLSLSIPTSVTVTDYSGTTLKTAVTSFLWQSDSRYFSANLLNTPSQVTLYGQSQSSPAAQTTTTYDESAYTASGGAVAGHPTTVSLLNNLGSPVVTHTAWTTHGAVDYTLDGKGVKNLQNTYAYTAYASQFVNLYPSSVANALHQSTAFTWDVNKGSPATVTDPNSVVTRYSYDTVGRILQIDSAVGTAAEHKTTYSYPDAVTVDVSSDKSTLSDGVLKWFARSDGLGRVIQGGNPNGTTEENTYDGLDNVLSTTNPHFSTSSPSDGKRQFRYDALNRMTNQTDSDGISTEVRSYSGNSITYTDEAQNQWTRVYDALGRLATAFEPNGASTTPTMETDYSYDAMGNLIQVDQYGGAKGNTQYTDRRRTFTYDSMSRLIQAYNPESGWVCYGTTGGAAPNGSNCTGGYDANGNPGARTDARGYTVNYTYDALNRKTSEVSVTLPTYTHTFIYDQTSAVGVTFTNPIGVLTAETTWYNGTPAIVGGTTLYWNHDPMGRVLGTMTCTPGSCNSTNIAQSTWYNLSNTYDLAGNMTSYSDGFGTTIGSTYDNAGRLASLTSSTNGATPVTLWTANTYGPLALTKGTFGNHAVQTLQYTNRLALQSSSTVNSASQVLYSEALTYYPNLNVKTDNDSVSGSWTYVHDTLNRVSSAVSPSIGEGCQFAYDPFGNRTQEASYQGSCFTMTLGFTSANQINGYCYDAAGNLLDAAACPGAGVKHQNYFDGFGQLLSPNYNKTDLSSYVVDAIGHRIGKYVSGTLTYQYIYGVDGHLITELNGSSWKQTNIYAGNQLIGELTTSGITYVHEDRLGTVHAWSNSGGTLLGKCGNLPFGEAINCTPLDFFYTGKERDTESGNDNFGARYYASAAGRFLSPDPSELAYADPTNPQSFNLYSYALNNPLINIDPTGLDACAYDTGNGRATIYNAEDGGGVDCPGNGFYITTDQQVTAVGFNSNGDLSVYGASGSLYNPDGSAYDASQSITVTAGGGSSYIGPQTISSDFQYVISRPPQRKGTYPDYKGFFCLGYGLKRSWPNLAIDAIGLIPEVEGGSQLVRRIGNFKGYRGIVADNYGKGVIKAVNGGIENAHYAEKGANLGRGIGEGDLAGVGLTIAGFIPGLGQAAAVGEMANDWERGMEESPECQ
jgi:RHS repeat-associated protein